MKKFLMLVTVMLCVLCGAFALAACDEKPAGEQADLWSMERVYATAQELGFTGSLEDLIAMFKGEKGEKGDPGTNGKDGKDGVDGKDGKDGENGHDGKDGKNGVGIQSVEIDENGHLIVTMTDGSEIDLGKITADEPAAPEGTEGLQYQKRKDEEGNEYAVVVGLGTAWDTDIVIPSVYRGLPVKEIGSNAFDASTGRGDARNLGLTSVSIPDSVTSIGEYVFNRIRDTAKNQKILLKQSLSRA